MWSNFYMVVFSTDGKQENMMKITVSKDAKSTAIDFNIPFEMSMLNEKQIHAHATRNVVVAIQGILRGMLKGSKNNPAMTPKQIAAECEKIEWVERLTPRETVSRVDKLANMVKGMSDEERAEFLKLVAGDKAA